MVQLKTACSVGGVFFVGHAMLCMCLPVNTTFLLRVEVKLET